jgi:hypothetical protein
MRRIKPYNHKKKDLGPIFSKKKKMKILASKMGIIFQKQKMQLSTNYLEVNNIRGGIP